MNEIIDLNSINIDNLVNFSEKEKRTSDYERIYDDLLDMIVRKMEAGKINEADILRRNLESIARFNSRGLYQSKRSLELLNMLKAAEFVPNKVVMYKPVVNVVQIAEQEPLRCDNCSRIQKRLILVHNSKERLCESCYKKLIEGRPIPEVALKTIWDYLKSNPTKAAVFNREDWYKWTEEWRRISWICGRDWERYNLRCIPIDGKVMAVAPLKAFKK